ncbi:tRNA-dihydrouridine synthase [Candidatus Pantoea edessiphila]|uniref:tRNA-dihydrouridine synthase n=1 Tax=Candidatus Pantoea edessiphila TaxID=2044610 RepID=UPI0030D61D28
MNKIIMIFLRNFIGIISESSNCKVFILHARKALLSKYNASKNLRIPPLNYSHVYRIKRDFPYYKIVINGGVETLEAQIHLQYLDGMMIWT